MFNHTRDVIYLTLAQCGHTLFLRPSLGQEAYPVTKQTIDNLNSSGFNSVNVRQIEYR